MNAALAVRHRTLLPHVLALLYGLAIAFASLQPFAPWIPPEAGTPFWLMAPWPPRFTRFDVVANFVAYVPFGLFVSLTPQRAAPRMRAGLALAAGFALSFALETLQAYLPPRDASAIDAAANAAGALAGGLAGAALARSYRVRQKLSAARHRVFLGGRLGDVHGDTLLQIVTLRFAEFRALDDNQRIALFDAVANLHQNLNRATLYERTDVRMRIRIQGHAGRRFE